MPTQAETASKRRAVDLSFRHQFKWGPTRLLRECTRSRMLLRCSVLIGLSDDPETAALRLLFAPRPRPAPSPRPPRRPATETDGPISKRSLMWGMWWRAGRTTLVGCVEHTRLFRREWCLSYTRRAYPSTSYPT